MLNIHESTNTRSPFPLVSEHDLWTGCEPARDPRSVASSEPRDARVWQQREHHWGQPPAVHLSATRLK